MNMATMAREECRATKEERAFSAWRAKVENLLHREVDEDDALDLYLDGCTAEEAAEEIGGNAR